NGSIRTVPVNQSAGPSLDDCEPTLLISMAIFSSRLPQRPTVFMFPVSAFAQPVIAAAIHRRCIARRSNLRESVNLSPRSQVLLVPKLYLGTEVGQRS